jgi:hypothetical protein
MTVMNTSKMVFTSWPEFMDEFTSIFCTENEATTVLIILESKQYFQGRKNIDAYTDELPELIMLSGYMDLISIIFKFCQGLRSTIQDKITESGTN